MIQKFYQHSVWSDNKEWIESDRQTFNDEVIEHREQFVRRYDFQQDKTVYYFDNKTNSAYDWKIEVSLS